MTWILERHGAVTSTMDVARTRARAGAPDRTMIIAESMSAGRGTHGRPWHAPKGGLYVSVVLRDVQDPHLLTLALGNAVAEVLEVAGVEPQLKWVNDVLVDGKKIAGILVEGEATGDKFDFLVAGIGINANGDPATYPTALRSQATTIEAELGCDTCVPDLEALLLQGLEKWLRVVRSGQGAEILAAFRKRDALRGKQVEVDDGSGAVKGVADGIDEAGRLRVKAGATVKTFATGSVRLVTK